MKKIGIEIKWGIIFAVCALLWMLFEKSMGWHDENIADHPKFTNLFGIIAIALYIVAVFDKKKNYYNGRITWLQGFVSGMFITLIVVVLAPISQWITHTWLSPEYFQNAIDYGVQHGYQTREQGEAYFNLDSYITKAMIGALVMGTVSSSLVALIGLIGNKK